MTKKALALGRHGCALGAALLVAAGFAGAASSGTGGCDAKKGGTHEASTCPRPTSTSRDPALAYGTISWQIEYTTALKLYNYPDKAAPLGGRSSSPRRAAGFPMVSKDGKTYTSRSRPGFKFSDGSPVTAANYAFAINRALNPTMQSPAAPFIDDIVGAQAVLDGKAQKASGVKAKGNKLIIKLTQPDGGLPGQARHAVLPALPTNMAIDPKGVNAYPSAGPYYIASRDVGRQIVAQAEPELQGHAPARTSTRSIITVNTDLDQSLLQVKRARSTTTWAACRRRRTPSSRSSSASTRAAFFVNPLVETDYVALNTPRPTFGNVERCARPRTTRSTARHAPRRAARSPASATDQILPPGMGGFKRRRRSTRSRARTTRRRRRSPAANCKHGRPLTRQLADRPDARPGPQVQPDADRARRRTSSSFQGFRSTRRPARRASDFDAAHRRLEPGLPRSVRLHQRPPERRQHPRRRTTTTSRTSTSPAINKQMARGQQAHRRRALQGVRQPRRRDHEELRAVGCVRQPQRA